MKLDMKHKNIGATIGLLKGIHLLGGDDQGIPNELTELFILESDSCDFKKDDQCTFDESGQKRCMIANCPLGDLTDKEFRETANSINLAMGPPIIGAG